MPDPTTLPMLSDAEWKALDDAAMSGKYGITPMGGSPSPPIPDSGGLPSMPSRSVAPLPATQEANIAAGTKLQPGVGKEMYARGLPSITAPPATPEYDVQKLERGDYQQIHPWGSQVSEHPGTGGKIAHVLSKIGNVAGDIVAPSTMALIPGTDLNKRMERGGELRQFGRDVESQEKEAQTGLLGAEAYRQLHPIEKVKDTVQDDKGNEWEIMESGAVRPAQTAGGAQLAGKPLDKTAANLYSDAISDAIKRGVDPNKDPKVLELADSIQRVQPDKVPHTPTEEEQAYAKWLKDNPNQKDTAANQLAFHQKWAPPNQIPLIIPGTGQLGGTFNPRTGKETETTPGSGATTAAGAAQGERTKENLQKQIEPVQGALEFATDYLQNGEFTGPKDEALQEKFFELAKPTTGFRMTQPQMDMLQNSRSWMNSAEAHFNHMLHGTWFSKDQREQIVQAMQELGKAKLAAIQGGGAAGGEGAPPPGAKVRTYNPKTRTLE